MPPQPANKQHLTFTSQAHGRSGAQGELLSLVSLLIAVYPRSSVIGISLTNARPDSTPLILTFNEAPNLRRTLEKLKWAKQIVVLDSFSTDETLEIARSSPRGALGAAEV